MKGGLALKDGKLFFGDYGGKVYAIRQARRPTGVASNEPRGSALGLRRRALLLDARGRVRARLHRQPRRLRLLVRGEQRPPRLAPQDRRASSTRRPPSRRSARPADGLHRLLRRQALRAERAVRRGPLDAQRPGGKISGGPVVIGDLVFYSNLTRRSTAAVGARTGQTRVEDRTAAPSTRRSPTAGGSTSTATRACSRSPSRDQARRDARVRLRDPVERRRARNRTQRPRREPARRGSSAAGSRGAGAPRRRVAARSARSPATAAAPRAPEICFRSNGRTSVACRASRLLQREPDVCRPRKPYGRASPAPRHAPIRCSARTGRRRGTVCRQRGQEHSDSGDALTSSRRNG